MGASAAAAIVIRREKDLVAHFRAAGAIAATNARSPSELGVHEQMAWDRLVDRAVIREAEPGRYYLDEASWKALRNMRRRMAVLLGIVLLGLFLTTWFATARKMTSHGAWTRFAFFVSVALTTVANPRLAVARGQVPQGGGDKPRIITAIARNRLDSTLRAFVDAGKIAGVSALVFEKGSEAYFGAFGMADREASIAMTRDAIVQIFSMTKPITGVALMTLYEQGKFQLDDPLAKYAPEFANMRVYAGADASGRPKLERRIGRSRFATSRATPRASRRAATIRASARCCSAADPLNRTTRSQQMAQKLGTVPLWFHPGEKWAYGPSVDVQAFLVERLSGQPYGEYVRQHVLGPLGMRETRYFVPESDRGRFAAMYNRSDAGVLSHGLDARTPGASTPITGRSRRAATA